MAFARKSRTEKKILDENKLYDYAIKALGRHMRSENELRRKMHERVEPGERGDAIIRSVLARLREYGYINDQSFAETYTRLRKENEKFGQRRVRQDLQQKGVSARLIDETLTTHYAGQDEAALARQYLERKRLKKPENDKESARIMRRLVTAGFSTGSIYKVLRAWGVPEEALAALDSVDEEQQEE